MILVDDLTTTLKKLQKDAEKNLVSKTAASVEGFRPNANASQVSEIARLHSHLKAIQMCQQILPEIIEHVSFEAGKHPDDFFNGTNDAIVNTFKASVKRKLDWVKSHLKEISKHPSASSTAGSKTSVSEGYIQGFSNVLRIVETNI